MATAVSPTNRTPEHHVSLTDGTNTVGFILRDQYGKRNERAFRRFPHTASALKTFQGDSKWSDQEFPYMTIAQDNFSGGRGNESFDSDKSMFRDSFRASTFREDGITRGGLETFLRGERHIEMLMPGELYQNARWMPLKSLSTRQQVSIQFTATANFTLGTVETWLKSHDSVNYLTAALYADSGDLPTGSALSTGTFQISRIPGHHIPFLAKITMSGYSIVSGTKYHVVFGAGGGVSTTKFWELLHLTGTTGAIYNGSAWSRTIWTSGPSVMLSATATKKNTKFYDYKGALYMFRSEKDDSASKLYMEGSRGVADSNAADLTDLYDATEPWVADSLSHTLDPYAICELVAGKGSNAIIPWRGIDGIPQNGSPLAMATDWDEAHDDTTEYVIKNVNYVREVPSRSDVMDAKVYDALQVEDYVVYSLERGLFKHREYNALGVWTESGAADGWMPLSGGNVATSAQGRWLATTEDNVLGTILWTGWNPVGRNDYSSLVLGGQPPKAWVSDTYFGTQMLYAGSPAMDEYVPTGVVVTDLGRMCKVAITHATFAGGTGVGVIVTDSVTKDMSLASSLTFIINTSKPLVAGDLQFLIDDTANCASPKVVADFPALDGSVRRVTIDIDTTEVDMSSIISFGFQAAVSQGEDWSFTVGTIMWNVEKEPIEVGRGKNVTGIETYDDPERVYVFTEDEVGFISGDKYLPIPLREMRSLGSSYNGYAHTVGGVYLYFGLGPDGRVQRYFRQTLDDLGLTAGTGMPEGRRGPVSCMKSYPGDILLVAVGPGGAEFDGDVEQQRWWEYGNSSSVMMYANGGWHEVYRTPRGGMWIDDMYLQAIPGSEVQWLWLGMDEHIVKVPICLNPFHTSLFPHFPEAHLETSWFEASMKDIQKLFKSVKLYTDRLYDSVTGGYNPATDTDSDYEIIAVDYRLDSETNSYTLATGYVSVTPKPWTFLGTFHTSSPSQEVNIPNTAGSAYPEGVAGKKIQLRFRMMGSNVYNTGRIVAAVVEAFAKIKVKWGYSWTSKVTEGDLSINLEGDEESTLGYGATAEAAVALLDSWADNLTPLTMNSVFSPMNEKLVLLDQVPMSPMRVLPDDQIEEHFISVRVNEL